MAINIICSQCGQKLNVLFRSGKIMWGEVIPPDEERRKA